MYDFLSEELAGWLDTKVYSEWSSIQLQLVSRGILQSSVSGQIFFQILMKNLDEKITRTLSKFKGNTKSGRTVDLFEGRKVLQSDLDRLDQWVESSYMTFNKDKWWVLHFSHNKVIQVWNRVAGKFAQQKGTWRCWSTSRWTWASSVPRLRRSVTSWPESITEGAAVLGKRWCTWMCHWWDYT